MITIFHHCTSLKEITLPAELESIGDDAFNGCNVLTSIVIPANVTTIGKSVFDGCNNLTTVYCKPVTPPVVEYNSFPIDNNLASIYVPTNSVSAYKSAETWSSYYVDYIKGYSFE